MEESVSLVGRNKRLPIHRRLFDHFAGLIESNRLLPGQAIPSEQAICKQFNVSRVTVRQAIANLAARGLVEKRWGSGTYVRDASLPLPATAGSGRAPVLSLILANITGSFMASIVRGVEQEARQSGYELSLTLSNSSFAQERTNIEAAIEKKVAGVILFPSESGGGPNPNCYHYLRLLEAGIPTLFVDSYLPQLPIGYVVSGNRDGMFRLTEKVIEMSHTRIGYLHSVSHNTSVTTRYEGFLNAMMARRLCPEIILRLPKRPPGQNDIDIAETAVRDLIQSGQPLPTALIGCTSYFAIGAFRAIKEAGLRVPEDITLAGYEHLPEADMLEIPLTSMEVPVEEMGRQAVRQIIEVIRQGGTGESVRVEIPAKFAREQSSEAGATASQAIGSIHLSSHLT